MHSWEKYLSGLAIVFGVPLVAFLIVKQFLPGDLYGFWMAAYFVLAIYYIRDEG